LKQAIVTKEQSKKIQEQIFQANQGVAPPPLPNKKNALQPSASVGSLYAGKNQRIAGGPEQMAESGKSYTIKKILNELEKELNQVEEENYTIVKEQAEQRLLRSNPKLALQRQKQMEKEMEKMRAKSPELS